MKILVADAIEEKGLQLLKSENDIRVDVKTKLPPAELQAIIGDYDALLVRSATKVTKEIIRAGKKLKVIGRAGVGVDNVDMEAATKQGVIVMNTPEGNTISTCEHTLSLLLSLNRNIPQAHGAVRKNEWKRDRFIGAELAGKTIGILGYGRIGREVAKRLMAFGMKILVFDPFISSNGVSDSNVEFGDLKTVLAQSDYITIHTPLTRETEHLIDREAFQIMKSGVRIVNCARGGIIDEQALYDAIKSGKVKGAALDVFEKEPPTENPLLTLDQVVVTPHLGASTEEAQENVSVAVAQQVLDVLKGREIRNAVNMPSLDTKTLNILRPWIHLAEKLGMMHTQLFEGSIKEVTVKYSGEVTQYTLAPLTSAALKGLLVPICGEGVVNYVNVPVIAKERGITVNESKTSHLEDFANFVSLEVALKEGRHTILGTLFGKSDPRIVKIDDFFLDAIPKGNLLVVVNEDKPGVVGEVGTVLGKNSINIAEMTLGRRQDHASALTVINIDGEVPLKVIEEIKKSPKIIDVKLIRL
ncbi:MAG: phosphoglycerate dehydrogenase [Candidatus Omnitrophica bacterium]|nr:phosphoglycerate dehydrogenase [Candidatus Omnitrophota bacterium]